jgi:hypothetical protein
MTYVYFVSYSVEQDGAYPQFHSVEAKFRCPITQLSHIQEIARNIRETNYKSEDYVCILNYQLMRQE